MPRDRWEIESIVQSDLTDDPNTAQHRTWNYLYDFVKQADLFLAVSQLHSPRNQCAHAAVLMDLASSQVFRSEKCP
jgi:hypothetical protein